MAGSPVTDGPGADQEAPYSLAQVFLFRQMPAFAQGGDGAAFGARLSAVLNGQKTLVSPLNISSLVEQDGQLHVLISFDRHEFRLIGFEQAVADEGVQRAIDCAHWPAEQKAAIRDHNAHLVGFYIGEHEDPGEQIIAFHRLAAAFVAEGLTGLVDPEAWNCIPAPVLAGLTQAKSLDAFRESMPAGLWTGFVKMFISETDVWFCTKGMHRWRRPDLAMRGTNDESQLMADRFYAMCNYAIAAPEAFSAGETAELGPGENFVFEPVTEYGEYLNSPHGTLVMRALEQH